MINGTIDLENKLKEMWEEECLKFKESIKEKIKKKDGSIAQTRPRRYGKLWQEMSRQVFMHSTNITVKDKVYYNEFVDKWKKDYEETLNKNCCKSNCSKIIDDFVSFGISTNRRDLCDYTLIETINGKEVKYAIEVKYSYNSGDSNTNREMVNSAIYLEYLGYKPIMLVRSEDNLEKVITRFKNSGWDVKVSKDAFDFIKQKAKFNEDSFCLKSWIEENIDIWDVIKDYKNELEKINHTKEKWSF